MTFWRAPHRLRHVLGKPPMTGTDHLATHVAQAIAVACAERDAEIERLQWTLQKIARRYPCETAEDMQRVAREVLGK
jgi:hypothetical protein